MCYLHLNIVEAEQTVHTVTNRKTEKFEKEAKRCLALWGCWEQQSSPATPQQGARRSAGPWWDSSPLLKAPKDSNKLTWGIKRQVPGASSARTPPREGSRWHTLGMGRDQPGSWKSSHGHLLLTSTGQILAKMHRTKLSTTRSSLPATLTPNPHLKPWHHTRHHLLLGADSLMERKNPHTNHASPPEHTCI